MRRAAHRNALCGCARLALFHTPGPLFFTANAEINLLFIFADHTDRGNRVVGRVAPGSTGSDVRKIHTIHLEMWLKRQVDRDDSVK